MHRDRLTRLLHLLLAVGITAELILSTVMVHPKPGRTGNLFYAWHETTGLALLGVLFALWVWVLIRRGPVPIGQLVPWFSTAHRQALWSDARRTMGALKNLTLPDPETPSPLASALHGLGLAVASLLALSGLWIYLGIPAESRPTGTVRLVKDAHEMLGPLMWAYLGAHAGIGLIHQVLGHPVITAMFAIGRGQPGK